MSMNALDLEAFGWIKVDPSPIVEAEPPAGIAGLSGAPPIYRTLARAYIEAHSADPAADLQGYDYVIGGDRSNAQAFDQWTQSLDANHYRAFRETVIDLRDRITKDPNAGKVLALAGGLGDYDGPIHAVALGAIQSVKEQFYPKLFKVKEGMAGITTWEGRAGAVALIDEPYTALQEAELDLKEIAGKYAGLYESSQASPDHTRAMVQSTMFYGEAVGNVCAGMRDASQAFWQWAQTETKKELKENFATHFQDVNDILVASECGVFLATNVLGALTPVCPILAPVAAVVGIAHQVSMAIVKEAQAKAAIEDPELVARLIGRTATEREEAEEAGASLIKGLGKASEIEDYGEKVKLGVELVSPLLGETVKKGVEEGAKAVGPTLTVVGPALSQFGPINSLWESAPGELRDRVPAEERQRLSELVTLAHDSRAQDLQFGQVRVLDYDAGSRAFRLDVDGETGWMSALGRFSSDNPARALAAAIAATRRDPNSSAQAAQVDWDQAQFIKDENQQMTVAAPVWYDDFGEYFTEYVTIRADGGLCQYPAAPSEMNGMPPLSQLDLDRNGILSEEYGPWEIVPDVLKTVKASYPERYRDQLESMVFEERRRRREAGQGPDYNDERY